MSDETPLDLRSLADVDSPEVAREALRTFRRRLWTRYLWIGLAIALGAVVLFVGSRPSNLREEMEAANVRAFPERVWRVPGATIALEEVADLGDAMGLHFVFLPDPDTPSLGFWVEAEHVGPGPGLTFPLYGMQWGSFNSYVKMQKGPTVLRVILGRTGCVPFCDQQEVLAIDLRELGMPESVWRAER